LPSLRTSAIAAGVAIATSKILKAFLALLNQIFHPTNSAPASLAAFCRLPFGENKYGAPVFHSHAEGGRSRATI